MKSINIIFLLSACFIFSCQLDNQNDNSNNLIDGFKDPPINAKPKGYWCLVNGNFDLTQMTNELKEYKIWKARLLG